MSSCRSCLLVAGGFFLAGLVLQVWLLQKLHVQPLLSSSLLRSEVVSLAGAEEAAQRQRGPPVRSDTSRDHFEVERTELRAEAQRRPAGSIPETHPEVKLTEQKDESEPLPETAVARVTPSVRKNIEKTGAKPKYYRDIIGEVPQIVQSWRKAQLDWHDLLPKHMSTWERFGEKKGLRLLVSKEEQITNYLTRFTESGLADAYGQDHGPLLAYSGCNKLRSDCMIHTQDGCQTNGLCMWNPEQELCVDYDYRSPFGIQVEGAKPNGRVKKCGSQGSRGVPTEKGVHGMKESDRKCMMWVDQPAIVFGLDGESQSMFYHWISSWGNIKNEWKNKLGKSRKSHIFMTGIVDTLLYGYFGMLTDFCWRRSSQELQPIPEGLCFCDIKQKPISQGAERSPAVISEVVETLQLKNIQPPRDRPKIGIISRRKKRFILNEFEMADIAIEMGYDVVLLPLETMTYYEQVREFRSLDVLVGLHGSALDNVLFLHPGSVMIQLMPYKNEHRASFVEKAKGSNVNYMEWQVKNLKDTFLHWDLYAQADTEKLNRWGKDKILQLGQKKATNRETLMFWINQDIIVPEEDWRKLLVDSVSKSNAKSRLKL